VADDSENEKTEDPTQKRLDDARAKGDVAKSQEINTWFVIAGATLVLSTFSGSMGGGILMPLRNLFANSWMIRTDGQSLLALAQNLEVALIAAIGVPLLMLMLAAIAGNMIQRRLMWSGEMKEEFKQSEGDPHVKGRIRQLRMARQEAVEHYHAVAEIIGYVMGLKRGLSTRRS
jgi:flagellar biosynthesis protein FlhB